MRWPNPLRAFASSTSGDMKSAPSGEAGADGDSWYDALLAGGPDVNPALSGQAKFPVFDEMRKTDPTIKSTLLFQKLPVRSATWTLEPADESPAARLVADFVAWNLGLEEHEGELDLSFDEVLQHLLTTLDFGPSLAELVWYGRPGDLVREWKDADGDTHLVRPLTRIAPRLPSSIQTVERKDGRIVKVTQNIPGTRPIPGEKIVHLVFEREGSRWDGVSMLRPAWAPWYFKKNLLISTGVGWDRFATGLPEIRHPDTPEGEEKAKEIGRSVRVHERGYVHFPGMEGQSDWAFKIHNAAASIADPVNLLRWCCEQEAEAGLAHFSSLGRTGTGAYSVGEVQVDPFFLAVQVLARYLAGELGRQVMRPLVALNFGEDVVDSLTPRLRVSKIIAKSVETITKALALIHDAGLAIHFGAVQSDIDTVRQMVGLDVLPDEFAAPDGMLRDRVLAAIQQAGVDPATQQVIAGQLPRELGVNGAGREGQGLVAG